MSGMPDTTTGALAMCAALEVARLSHADAPACAGNALRAAVDRDVAVRIIPHLSHTLCPDTVGSIQRGAGCRAAGCRTSCSTRWPAG